MVCPGDQPMAPADLSNAKALSFWAKGDGQTYAVMVYAAHRGYMSAAREFVAGDKWRQYTFPLAMFEGMDGSDITGILFGRAPVPGSVRFQIDNVRFTAGTDVPQAQPNVP